jgi:hypothetical protein
MRSSNVPLRRSSAKCRIVIIGNMKSSAIARLVSIVRRLASPVMLTPR